MLITFASSGMLQKRDASQAFVFDSVKTTAASPQIHTCYLFNSISVINHKNARELTPSNNEKRQAVIACLDYRFALSSEYLAHIQIEFFMGGDVVNSQPRHRANRRVTAEIASVDGLTQPKTQIDYSSFPRPMLSREATVTSNGESWGLTSGVFCSVISGRNIG